MEPVDPIRLLYDHQVEHVLSLERCLIDKPAVLEASDTGMGKTIVWCVIAARSRRKLFVVCPKQVVGSWFTTAAHVGATIIGVSNYELAKHGKYYTSEAQYLSNASIACPYMGWPANITRKNVETLALNFPADALIVIDEAHRGKNNRTQTAALLKRIRMYIGGVPTIRMAILSATITDTIEDFRMTAFVIGVAQYEIHPYKAWIRSISIAGETISSCIHKAIFPAYGARMRKATITANESLPVDPTSARGLVHFHMFKWMMSLTPGQSVHADIYVTVMQMYDACRMFRDSNVRAVVYEVSPEIEASITDAYGDLNDAVQLLRQRQAGDVHPLTMILRARQRLEMLKSQTMIDQAMEFLASGFAVVLFVNFKETLKRMVAQLTDYMSSDEMLFEDACGNAYHKPIISVIHGKQSASERAVNMAQFQDGTSLVCVSIIQAGGLGIDLHHKFRSAKPRKTLFSPPWSAIVLSQGLGRVDRVGALSDSEQIIVYCKGAISAVDATGAGDGMFNGENGTRVNIEEIMAANINRKLELIGMLNDGDLDGITKI